MTPSLFDLPVRPPEVARCAVLILEQVGEKPLTEELRGRVAGRSALLKLQELKPYFASLERDPVHPSAFYLAVDGLQSTPLLLRIAPNATPSSGLYPKSILIGRMPGPGGIEIVVNATPFAHTDAEAISKFAGQVNRAFSPRPAGPRSAIVVASTSPETVLPVAFEAFRQILRTRGLNFAGAKNAQVATWAAIRGGWREGYVTDAAEAGPCSEVKVKRRAICTLNIEDAASAAEEIEQCSQFLS